MSVGLLPLNKIVSLLLSQSTILIESFEVRTRVGTGVSTLPSASIGVVNSPPPTIVKAFTCKYFIKIIYAFYFYYVYNYNVL